MHFDIDQHVSRIDRQTTIRRDAVDANGLSG
jgi:hypothetical protein